MVKEKESERVGKSGRRREKERGVGCSEAAFVRSCAHPRARSWDECGRSSL